MFSGRLSPPGKESESRSLGWIRGGNEADEASRQSGPWEGERVTGPQRSEPIGGLEKNYREGRAHYGRAKAA
jgi:hypothetical protein